VISRSIHHPTSFLFQKKKLQNLLWICRSSYSPTQVKTLLEQFSQHSPVPLAPKMEVNTPEVSLLGLENSKED
jgi:hypothetical protein